VNSDLYIVYTEWLIAKAVVILLSFALRNTRLYMSHSERKHSLAQALNEDLSMFLKCNLQTEHFLASSGAHPTSYSIGTQGSFSRGIVACA
jgi:hypothetical protein